MYVMGVDLGTSNVKAAVFELPPGRLPRAIGKASVPAPLLTPSAGRVEVDADEMVTAARAAIEQASAEATARLRRSPRIRCTGWSGAMHSLLLLGRDGAPLGPGISWADTRASLEARALREEGDEIARRTGVPVHPMSLLCKLLWMRGHDAARLDLAHRVTGVKEYVAARVAEVPCEVMDRSMASGTGLYDGRGWDAALLARLHLDEERMPRIVEATHLLNDEHAAGAGDGPLASLGCGAVADGAAALTMGSSGALRIPLSARRTDPRLFCYDLAEGVWIVGGAVSSGGLILDWASRAWGFASVRALLAEAATVPSTEGLVMIAHLAGERAPHWAAHATGSLVGLRLSHTRSHLARAAVEATAFAIGEVLEALPDAPLRAILTGAITRSPFWMQVMADVTGLPLALPFTPEPAALGAALIAGRACGAVDDLVRMGERIAGRARWNVQPREDLALAARFWRYQRVRSTLAEISEP